jgi:hypothetical protein
MAPKTKQFTIRAVNKQMTPAPFFFKNRSRTREKVKNLLFSVLQNQQE